MATEIERKFLTSSRSWQSAVTSASDVRQAYLAITPTASIRIRIKNDAQATLTIKSTEAGPSRSEFEYEVPVGDAKALFGLRTGHIVEKRRHIVDVDGLSWEVDVFAGVLEGLVIAELELDDEEQHFRRPDWLGDEVTSDRRYHNAALARDGLPR